MESCWGFGRSSGHGNVAEGIEKISVLRWRRLPEYIATKEGNRMVLGKIVLRVANADLLQHVMQMPIAEILRAMLPELLSRTFTPGF